jgi:type IV pilus assembly protein PilC
MPKFAYTALDENGERVEGVMTAESQTTIRRELQDQGFRPLSVAPKSSVLQLEITKEKVSKEEVMHFSRQLSVFIKAGIPIMEALRVIGDEVQDKLMKKIIFDMIEAIYDGETFAAAAASHPEAFPNYYIGMLQSAELTGNLDGTLNQLADYMKRDIDARAKLKSALIYPAVVMALSVVVVLILTVYVLPKFQVFFKQLNAKLPLPTRMLLGLSGFMSSYWWLLLIIAIGGVITIVAMRRNPVGHARIDEFLLRIPVLGDLIRTAIIERTCRVLASMIDTGVPLPDALSVAADCANNTVYREGLDHIRSQMMEGRGLAAPLSETGLFPGAAHQMFRVGEETGTLNDQMDVAADYYSRELDVKLSNFTSLFEPAIIIAVGIVVGFVAVALVSAMYGIYNQVKAT